MAAFKTLGDWLQGYGWTSVLTTSEIVSSGVPDLLKASHLIRTRHMHLVTAAALFMLKHRAFLAHKEECPHQALNIDDLEKKNEDQQPV